jgi:hypothetical protein
MSRFLVRAGFLVAGLLSLTAPAFGAGAASTSVPKAKTSFDGTLQTLVEDYTDGHSRTLHFLDTDHGRYAVHFRGKPALLPSGTRVRANGRATANVLELDGAGDLQTIASIATGTFGEQQVAVILVNFSDDTTQPRTPADAGTLVLGTVSNHYKESSFGQTWFKGQVFGYYTVGMSKTVCDAYKLASLADAAATAAGANLSAFNRKIYMFPRNACAWSGLGNVGGTNTMAWVNGSFSTLVVAHEMGHNYGLYHAQSVDCDVSPLGNSCTTSTYGDTADMMGNYRAAQFNPFEKELLGWLNDGVSPPITTVTTSGRYKIEPYSAGTVGAKAIRVPRGNGNYYYIEYRQPIGADSVLATTGNLTRGVIVRTATPTDATSSRQLDMTPGTSTSYSELADGALEVGRSYTDATAGVTISLAAADTTGASIDVSFGSAPAPTCTHATPSLSVSGPTASVAAGTTQTYSVTLANRDSSACAATAFTLARSLPSGWTGTLSSTSVTLSPGTSASATLTATSPATAAAGTYALGVGASSAIGSIHTTSASASYAVAAAAAPAGVLTDSIATDKTSYLRGETAYISTLVKSDGVPVSGASVTFTITTPTGSSVLVVATTGSDGMARTSYRIGKGKAAMGSYVARATAVKDAVNASSNTAFSAN